MLSTREGMGTQKLWKKEPIGLRLASILGSMPVSWAGEKRKGDQPVKSSTVVAQTVQKPKTKGGSARSYGSGTANKKGQERWKKRGILSLRGRKRNEKEKSLKEVENLPRVRVRADGGRKKFSKEKPTKKPRKEPGGKGMRHFLEGKGPLRLGEVLS